MSKKIFIPGWFDTADNHVDCSGLEIWKNKIDFKNKIEAEYVIGHSLGANFALMNWEKNKNTKLILINPLLPKRNLFFWMIIWAKATHMEGTPLTKERLRTFFHPIIAIRQCLKLLSEDLLKTIENIPQENLTIIRGELDKYFFDKKTAEEVRLKNIRLIEIEGVGHNWDEKFNIEIEKIVTGP
jgi:hypothetical protein